MKKLISTLLIGASLLLSPLYSDGIPYYPDWTWTGSNWQYTGTENPPPLPPPIPNPPSPK